MVPTAPEPVAGRHLVVQKTNAIRCVAAVLAMIGSVACGCWLTDDETMIRAFQKRRAALETIARMMQEDGDLLMLDQDKLIVDPDRADPESYLSEERVRMYRDLLREAGVHVVRALSKRPSEEVRMVEFEVTECGILHSMAFKGYAYSPPQMELIEHVVDNLEGYGARHRNGFGRMYRRVDREWFLYVTPP